MKDEIDKFLQANDVDDRCSNDLRACPPEVQRIVLSRGDLSTARNPSAALIARIRDARTSVSNGSSGDRGGCGGGSRSNPSGDPSVEAFLRSNDVDESAAASLRGCPPDVQRTVIARGDLTGARNPSSALLSRSRDATQGGGGNLYGGGYGAYGSGCGGSSPLGGMPPAPGYPPQMYGGGAAGAYGGNYGMYPGCYAMPGYGMAGGMPG